MYAATVALVSLAAGAMRAHALRAGLVSGRGLRTLSGREHWALVPALFLVSMPLAFVSTTAAVLTWLLLPFLPLLRWPADS